MEPTRRIDPKKKQIAIQKVVKIIKFRRVNGSSKRVAPSQYSKDPVERSLGNSLNALKSAKRRPATGKNIFYDNLEKIASDYSDPELFDYVNKKKKATDKLQEIADWIVSNGRLPKCSLKNELEWSYNKRLQNLRNVREGKLQGVWYPELDSIMESIGYSNFFGLEADGMMIECDVNDLLYFYKKFGRNPSQLSDSSDERRLYRKLIRHRQIKQGKTTLKWNPEIDLLLKQKKMRNIFNPAVVIGV